MALIEFPDGRTWRSSGVIFRFVMSYAIARLTTYSNWPRPELAELLKEASVYTFLDLSELPSEDLGALQQFVAELLEETLFRGGEHFPDPEYYPAVLNKLRELDQMLNTHITASGTN